MKGCAVGLLDRILGRRGDSPVTALYAAIVERARAPHWYEAGQVPDTVDGRFDMIAAVLTFVLLRLERDAEGATPSALLAERFVTDMDGQLRELGIGDVGIGKHVGKMMGMLGGRLGAYRDGLAEGTLDTGLVRNLYRGVVPAPDALAHVRDALVQFHEALAAVPTPALIAGDMP